MRRGYLDPRHVIGKGQTNVLLALIDIYVAVGRATVRDVAFCAGYSISTTYSHLSDLREEGLVDWEPRRSGTLRPTLAVVLPHAS